MNSLEPDASDGSLVALADLYAAKMGVSLWWVGHLAANRSSFFVDLKKKQRYCQTNTYMRVLRWFFGPVLKEPAWPSALPRPARPHTL